MQRFIRTFFVFLLGTAVCSCQVRDIFRDIRRIFNIGDGVIDNSEEISAEYDFVVIGAGMFFLNK